MPYEVRREGDQWCVYVTATGEAKGCSDSEQLAYEHIAAMEAGEKALDPAGYVYVSLANDPAVMAVMRDAQAVMDDEGIEWEAAPTLHITLAYAPVLEHGPALGVALPLHLAQPLRIEFDGIGVFENGESRAMHIRVRPTEYLQAFQRDVVAAFNAYTVPLSPYSDPEQWQPHITLAYLPPGIDVPPLSAGMGTTADTVILGRGDYEPFAVITATQIKMLSTAQIVKSHGDSRRLMVLRSSNAYRDREDEIISQKALQGYVAEAWNEHDDFVGNNPLLLWHAGDPIGDIVYAEMDGPFLLEVAQERPNTVINLAADGEVPLPVAMKAVWDALEQLDDLGASPAFYYELGDREDKVYERIYKVETSVLPRWAAANLFTDAEIVRSAIDG
jgi:2'-5' RNA ligase